MKLEVDLGIITLVNGYPGTHLSHLNYPCWNHSESLNGEEVLYTKPPISAALARSGTVWRSTLSYSNPKSQNCWQVLAVCVPFVGLHMVINNDKLQTVVLDQVLKTLAELTPRASLAALNASRYFHVIQFSPFWSFVGSCRYRDGTLWSYPLLMSSGKALSLQPQCHDVLCISDQYTWHFRSQILKSNSFWQPTNPSLVVLIQSLVGQLQISVAVQVVPENVVREQSKCIRKSKDQSNKQGSVFELISASFSCC